jgi:hypothetical protein
MEPADVLVFTYAAVLDYLDVDELPRGFPEGCAGRRAMPSLTTDALLTGLALSQSGVRVDAALSAPGSSPYAQAATKMISDTIRRVRFGPDRGTPLELHIRSSDGNSMWFSAPSAGVSSLYEADLSGLNGDWLLVDSFRWLEPARMRAILPRPNKGLYVNFGKQRVEEAIDCLTPWLGFAPQKLVVQISLGAVNPATASQLVDLIRRESSDFLLIATLSSNGLVIADAAHQVWESAAQIPQVMNGADPSGAGAAVAAALLLMLLRSDVLDFRLAATALALAGAKQCGIDGALDATSRKAWIERLSSISPIMA